MPLDREFATALVAKLRERAEQYERLGLGPLELMSDWGQEVSGCGTVGCIAGEGLLLLGLDPMDRPSSLVREKLGRDSYGLFFQAYWPEPFRSRYDAEAATAASEARLMAEVLEHWIANYKEPADAA